MLIAQHAENNLLGAMIADPSVLYMAVDQGVTYRDFVDEKNAPIAQAVWECYSNELEPTRSNLLMFGDALKLEIDPTQLNHLDRLGTLDVINAAQASIELVLQFSLARLGLQRLEMAKNYLTQNPTESVQALRELVDQTLNLTSSKNRTIRDASPAAIRRDNPFMGTPVSSGLTWVDQMLRGGLRPSNVIGVMGKYKDGKTTLIRHAVLRLALSGTHVTYFTYDGTRRMFLDSLTAMLATARLRTQQIPEIYWTLDLFNIAPPEQGEPDHLTADQRDAVRWAENKSDQLKIHIYDGTDDIHEVGSIMDVMRRNIEKQASKVMVVDFIQKVSDPTKRTSFESFESVVGQLQRFTVSKPIISVWATQRNESANNNSLGGDGAGVKGGGSLPAAIDFLFHPQRDGGMMRVNAALAKYNGNGYMDYMINPSSGLILNAKALP